MKGQPFPIPLPGVTPHRVLCCSLGLMQSCHKPETVSKTWRRSHRASSEMCPATEPVLMIPQQKNAVMDLWRKTSGYQTAQWWEGHNLLFRDASLMKVWNKQHNRAEIEPQPWRFSGVTEQGFIAPTPQKYTGYGLSQWLSSAMAQVAPFEPGGVWTLQY